MDLTKLVRLANANPPLRSRLVPEIKKLAGGKHDKFFEDGVEEVWPIILKALKTGDAAKIEKTHRTNRAFANAYFGAILSAVNSEKNLLDGDRALLVGGVNWRPELVDSLEKYSKFAGQYAASWAGMHPDLALKSPWHKELFPGLEEAVALEQGKTASRG